MSRKPAPKRPGPSKSPAAAEMTRTIDLAARLPSVPPAPGEHPDHASTIPLVVHARFTPRNGFETMLVEEIADLTRRIRLDERRMEQIHRVKRNDLLISAMKRSAMAKGSTADASDKMAGELIQGLASDSAEDVQDALSMIATYGVDIEKIDAQAWISSDRYIDQLNRQIGGCRRQRQQAITDLEHLQRTALLDAIADAEEVN